MRTNTSVVAMLGLGFAAVCAACAAGYTAAPIRSNALTGARWQDPGYFRHEAVARADWIERQVRADVDDGRVPAPALADLARSRRALDQLLDAASADGAIDRSERDAVQSQLDRMGQTSPRYGGPGVYGGGPRAAHRAGEELYEHNWRRLW